MECCRMYALTMCALLLCTGLYAAVPDSPDARDRKLQELLRTLDAYSPDSNAAVPAQQITTDSSSYHSLVPTVPSFLNLHLHRSSSEDSKSIPSSVPEENLLPDGSQVKSLQDFYRTFYGTPEGISYLRKQYGPNGLQRARAKYGVNRELEDVRSANDHLLRVRNHTRCKHPVPKVVHVKSYYPDPTKEYLPRCTVLHRCGDDTGCCVSDAFHCVPSAMQEVALHFYTLSASRQAVGYKSGYSIAKLLFVNHTSCQCQPINELPRMIDGRQDEDLSSQLVEKSKCGDCPVPFTSRIYKDGRCGCDCFDKQKRCIKIKRGREPLSDIERRCVEANHCHIPDCEYGLFDVATGYCPKRHDEDQRPSRRAPHRSATHRWAFLERD